MAIEYTDDPHPRNTYWEMWGMPMFDLKDAAGVLLRARRLPQDLSRPHYIQLTAFDSTHGWESLRLSFIVNRPAKEPGFALERQEVAGRAHPLHARSALCRPDQADGSARAATRSAR